MPDNWTFVTEILWKAGVKTECGYSFAIIGGELKTTASIDCIECGASFSISTEQDFKK